MLIFATVVLHCSLAVVNTVIIWNSLSATGIITQSDSGKL